MKLHQDGNRIVVTELNPISDLKQSDGDVLIFIEGDEEVSCLAILRLDGCGNLTDDQIFTFPLEHSGCVGWLPIPIYETKVK